MEAPCGGEPPAATLPGRPPCHLTIFGVEDSEAESSEVCRNHEVEQGSCGEALGNSQIDLLEGRCARPALCVPGREEAGLGHERVGGQLAKGCQVVQNPEGAALRRNHQITAMHFEIHDRRGRQIHPQRLPAHSVVERGEDAEFGAGVEESTLLWILAHDANPVVRGNAVGAVRETRPRAPVVVRSPDVGTRVPEAVRMDREKGAPRLVCGDLDRIHRGQPGEVRGCHVRPSHSVVPRQVDAAVVRTGPERPGVVGRHGQLEHGCEDLHPSVVGMDRTTGKLQRARVGVAEIG